MRREVKDFKRKELFDMYHARCNPFLIITTKVDITNIVNYCKIHKNNYATIGYVILKTVNEIECFKYRYINGKHYKYDNVNLNITQMINEDEIGFFTCEQNNYNEYIRDFNTRQEKMIENGKPEDTKDLNRNIWISCAPWFEFTSLVTPYDKNMTIPQFIWGKFIYENDKVYTNMMIMAHHGYVDGNHINMFLKKFKRNVDNFDEIIKEA